MWQPRACWFKDRPREKGKFVEITLRKILCLEKSCSLLLQFFPSQKFLIGAFLMGQYIPLFFKLRSNGFSFACCPSILIVNRGNIEHWVDDRIPSGWWAFKSPDSLDLGTFRFPYYSRENWGSVGMRDSSKVTLLMSGRAGLELKSFYFYSKYLQQSHTASQRNRFIHSIIYLSIYPSSHSSIHPYPYPSVTIHWEPIIYQILSGTPSLVGKTVNI